MTLQPREARIFAHSDPMPSSELAPVTMAALPLMSNCGVSCLNENACEWSRFLTWRMSLIGKPVPTFPGHALTPHRHVSGPGDDVLRQRRDRAHHRLDLFAGARIDLEPALL